MSAPKTAAELFSETPEPRNTRERILYTSLDLFYAYGFHAVGLDQILAEVGVTKTTFYNHFESRDELIREAVTYATSGTRRRSHDGCESEPAMRRATCCSRCSTFSTSGSPTNGFRGCLFVHACAD